MDRKTAAASNGYTSSSALDTPVKKCTISNGHYYMLYDQCGENIKQAFEQKIHGEPLLYKDGVGQYDENNQLIQEFICKYECLKRLKMSDKTLAKALDKNVLYNHFYYRSLGSKFHC